MKRTLRLVFCVTVILGLLGAHALADAKVHYGKTPPADWYERDLLRLTMFPTVLNDAMLLEMGDQCMIIDGAFSAMPESCLPPTVKWAMWTAKAACM